MKNSQRTISREESETGKNMRYQVAFSANVRGRKNESISGMMYFEAKNNTALKRKVVHWLEECKSEDMPLYTDYKVRYIRSINESYQKIADIFF